MSLVQSARKPRNLVLGLAALVFLVAVVAPFVYINFIKSDAPDPLGFEDLNAQGDSGGATGTAGAATGEDPTTTTVDGSGEVAPNSGSGPDGLTPDLLADGELTGEFVVTGGQAGYRAGEVLFGQDTEGVGRTDQVSGSMTVEGTTVTGASFAVDMASIESDESRRDGQFHGRIMDTSTYPTSTFVLTQPIELPNLPEDLAEVTVSVTGEFFIRGVTNTETFDLTARRNGNTIEVSGAFNIVFDDYSIPDASGGPATVKDNGDIEFALVFSRTQTPADDES